MCVDDQAHHRYYNFNNKKNRNDLVREKRIKEHNHLPNDIKKKKDKEFREKLRQHERTIRSERRRKQRSHFEL